MNVPTLKTSRLILTELCESDIEEYQELFNNWEVIRHLAAGVPWPYPSDGVKTFLQTDVLPMQANGRWLWTLRLQQTNQFIGSIDLVKKCTPANRGFWLGQKFWGHGYMTEAVEATTECAFIQLGFEKLVLANAVGNLRSRRIKEKAGAKFLRAEPAAYVDATLGQRELWELTKEDWLANRK